MATLMRYEDATELRPATLEEERESVEAASRDGGAGCITVEIDGEDVTCYVLD